MAYAWTAIDPDGFILESHYNIISSIFPSALRSEVFALLHGLDSLPRNSKITVATNCAHLLSLWSLYLLASYNLTPYLWLCPQCNSSPETLDHLWTCPYILPEFSPLNTFKTLLLALRTNYLDKFLSASSLILLPDSFVAKFMALDYTPLHDFHFDLYIQIWLCRSIFFHHWELAQGITKKMKSSALGPSSILCPSSNIPLDSSTPSLATASLDSWVSWVSSSIIRGDLGFHIWIFGAA
ncbi:hypothetical protein GLOIN_2v1785823 [Rhizophagus irregularis DAOM 181602=DAOM 197198]|nr:hypothetical protein GLOIN_2v1785823 [Rhizophagus irregularis DAOM 181602=DAOM 197198]